MTNGSSSIVQKLWNYCSNLDIFCLKGESLEDSANVPDPDVIAAEIAEDFQAALDQFSLIAADWKPQVS
jgi:type I restriction enzyme M protein